MDNPIQGQAAIQSLDSFENDVKATVDANVSGGTLSIQAPTTNYRTLEATASMGESVGGTLEINGTSLTNEIIPAPIPAPSPRTPVTRQYHQLNDHRRQPHHAGGSVIHGSSVSRRRYATTGSTYAVDPGGATELTSNLTNQGTINVGDPAGGARPQPYPAAPAARCTSPAGASSTSRTLALKSMATTTRPGRRGQSDAGRGLHRGPGFVRERRHRQRQRIGRDATHLRPDDECSGRQSHRTWGRPSVGRWRSTGQASPTPLIPHPGTISTDALTVNIISSTITGDDLTSAGGSVLRGSSVYSDGVTLTTGSIYSVDPVNLPTSPAI